MTTTTAPLYCRRCSPFTPGAGDAPCVRCSEGMARQADHQQHLDRIAAEEQMRREIAAQAERDRIDREFPFVVVGVAVPSAGLAYVGRYRTMDAAREAAAEFCRERPWLRNQDVRIETPQARRICYAGPCR